MRLLRQIPLVYWLALLLPWIAITQLFTGSSLPDTADGIFHTHRIYAMTELMRQGSIYPRWIPWFHLGYGYPVFNYYASLATWLGGILGLLGLSAPLAFQWISALSWMLGAVGMTALARRFLPGGAALAAAALWTYAPTRMQEYWIQGSLSHIVATALVPWVFLALLLLIQGPSLRRVLQFAVVTGLLILTHQPTTYLCGLFAAGLGLALLIRRLYLRQNRLWPVLRAVMLGLALSLALAAVLLLPMLLEIDAIIINEDPVENIAAILNRSAIPLARLFVQPGPLDSSDLSATIPHTYGLLTPLPAVAGLLALLIRRRYALAALLTTAAVLAIFLATPDSLGIWQSLPLMDQLRFPWRVLRIGIVPLSLLAAACLGLSPRRWQPFASAGLIALAILVALPTVYPTGRSIDYEGQTAADLIRYEIERGAYGGTSYNEFKPAWGERIPTDPPEDFSAYATDPMQLHVAEAYDTTVERSGPACWLVSANDPTPLDFRQFYFPGWQATLNGEALPLEAEPVYGLLRVELFSAENASLCLNYEATPLQRIAGWITVVTLGLMAALWLRSRRRPMSGAEAITLASPVSKRWSALVGAGLLGAALLNGLWIGPQTQWFRLHSPVDSPADMQTPAHSAFARGYELLGYTLPEDSFTADQSLSLTLFWRPLGAVDGGDYFPLVQLQNLSGTAALASRELPYVGTSPYEHSSERFISQRVTLPLFDDPPPLGQIAIRLVDRRSDTLVPLAEGDTEQIVLPELIQIQSQHSRPETSEQAYDFEDVISLDNINVETADNGLTLRLTWTTQQALTEEDVMLFVHALDSQGTLLAQLDTTVFGGDYPARYWRSGQTLVEQYQLPESGGAAQLALGLYTPARRLTALREGQPVTDNQIIIDLP